jgi:hypothetical protein
MRQNLTVDLVRRLTHTPPPPKAIDIYDAQQPRLVLRARPSGQHAYRLSLGRGRWYSLGSVSAVPSPAKARLLAHQQLGEYVSGRDPRAIKRRQLERSSRAYLTDVYAPWLTAHRRRPVETIARLDAMLAQFSAHKLSGISAWDVERWRTARLKWDGDQQPSIVTSAHSARCSRAPSIGGTSRIIRSRK